MRTRTGSGLGTECSGRPSLGILMAVTPFGLPPGPDITVAGRTSRLDGVSGVVFSDYPLLAALHASGIDPYLAAQALVYVALVILLTLVIWQACSVAEPNRACRAARSGARTLGRAVGAIILVGAVVAIAFTIWRWRAGRETDAATVRANSSASAPKVIGHSSSCPP